MRLIRRSRARRCESPKSRFRHAVRLVRRSMWSRLPLWLEVARAGGKPLVQGRMAVSGAAPEKLSRGSVTGVGSLSRRGVVVQL